MSTQKDAKKSNVFKDEEGSSTEAANDTVLDSSTTENSDTNSAGEKTSLGLEPNIAAFIGYLFGLISGIIIFLLEKENRFVRFHAMQSILVSAAFFIIFFILGMIPLIGWLLTLILAPLSFILWIYLLFKSFKGEWFKLPWVGDIAEQQIEKV